MNRLIVSCVLAAAGIATVAQAQQFSMGHVAYTGSSVDFEDNHENSTVVLSRNLNYEFLGFGLGWSRFHRPPVPPAGLGVTTLPDGRRCVFWIETENLRTTCELNARRSNWGPVEDWPQPFIAPMLQFRFKRIAVLGPSDAASAANGQVPMVFAIGSNSNVLILRQYRNGSWGKWQRIASLKKWIDLTPTSPADVSAAWAPECRTPNGVGRVVEVNVAAGSEFHRLWTEAGTSENSAPPDYSDDLPDVGEQIKRVAPLPTYCIPGSVDFGYSLFVTSSGALYESSTYYTVDLHSLAVPAPVRGITAFGPRFNYRFYMIDVDGNAWTTTYVAGVLGQWRLME